VTRRRPGRWLAAWCATAGIAASIAASAVAADLHVISAHAPATAAGATSAAVYLSVHNVGAAGDRLLRVSTPVATQAEFHRSQLDGAVMRMRPVPALEVPVGGSIEMSSGGLHIMLLGLRHPLQAGAQFPMRLDFARAGALDIQVTVTPLGVMRGTGGQR
jgi:copper(I)-binding protein